MVQMSAREEFKIESLMKNGRRADHADRRQVPLKIKSRSDPWEISFVGLDVGHMSDVRKIGRASSARPVLLERCEEIKPVEADAFHGSLSVEPERGIRPVNAPAELPMGLDDERGNRPLLRNGTNEPVRQSTPEQII
jgi:hypothetical protein